MGRAPCVRCAYIYSMTIHIPLHGVCDTAQAVAYQYNTDFSKVLQQRMEYFSTNANADVINRVRGEITQVRGAPICTNTKTVCCVNAVQSTCS